MWNRTLNSIRPAAGLWAAVWLVLVTNAFSQAAGSGVSSREEKADAATFKAVCGSCHPTSMVNGLRTESEWLEEIEQMIKIGARGTDAQFERVMRVLTRTLTKVNVNTAPAREIAPVLGISEASADALVRYRDEHGSFKSLDDLKKLPDINASKLDERRARIVF